MNASRRNFLVGMAAAAVPVAALPALATPGDDAELVRLAAELRPAALAYGKLKDRWHEAEHDFADMLAEHGLTERKVHAAVGLTETFALRRRHGVEVLVEEVNRTGEALDAICTAINEVTATTLVGLEIKLTAMLIEIGTDADLVYADPSKEWFRERIEDFLGDLRGFAGRGRGAA